MTPESNRGDWLRIQQSLPKLLPEFLLKQRWFGGKARPIQSIDVIEAVPIAAGRLEACVFLVRVKYADDRLEIYSVPLILGSSEEAAQLQIGGREVPSLKAPARESGKGEVLYDALWHRDIQNFLLEAINRDLCFQGGSGEILASHTQALRQIWNPGENPPEPSLMKAEQSNSSILYGGRFVLKFFRRLEEGRNPDLEIGAFLTERAKFSHVPPIAGALEYRRSRGEPMTIAFLQGFVRNHGDAWEYSLQALSHYYEQVMAYPAEAAAGGTPPQSLLPSDAELPVLARKLLGSYVDSASLLGRRTAELHAALGTAPHDADFEPEPFSSSYQQSLYQDMADLTTQTFLLLRRRLGDVPEAARDKARTVLGLEEEIFRRFRLLLDGEKTGMRIRIHGDYHLGQVLFTGDDFVIIDFEGEPARSLSERRAKHSPLRDVAGMLRSFHYAAYAALFRRIAGSAGPQETLQSLEPWATYWYEAASFVYLKAYLAIAAPCAFMPRSRDELEGLLKVYLLEKAVYELKYELNNRPEWLRIPLEGICILVEGAG